MIRTRFRLLSILQAIATGLALFAMSCASGQAADAQRIISGNRLGNVPYYLPVHGKPADILILFADGARTPAARSMAKALTGLNVAVAVIDTPAYLRALQADKGDCVWLSSDVEGLNHALQRKLHFPQFRLPVLISAGQGGALVYGLLAEAPSYSFAGGVSVGFSPKPLSNLNICGVGRPDFLSSNMPAVDLKQPWSVEPATPEDAAWVGDIDKASASVRTHGQTEAQLVSALTKPLIEAATSRDPNSLEDLPLIEMPPKGRANYIAIILSGDGGWRDLDRTLGQVLSDHGVPVVGVDSLLYFWQPKRPEIVAHDLDRIMDHYAAAWQAQKFVLIGFSFGADILPFAYNRLTAENKARVAEISLLALSRNTRFEISVSEYFSNAASGATLPIAPELAQLPGRQVQCIYGRDEASDTACSVAGLKHMEVIELSGGHHFDEDYEALAKRIMDGALKRLKS